MSSSEEAQLGKRKQQSNLADLNGTKALKNKTGKLPPIEDESDGEEEMDEAEFMKYVQQRIKEGKIGDADGEEEEGEYEEGDEEEGEFEEGDEEEGEFEEGDEEEEYISGEEEFADASEEEVVGGDANSESE